MRDVRETCSKPGCAAVPTNREDVHDARGLFSREPRRSYLLCDRHNEDYFNVRSGWLTKEKSERIKAELIVKELQPIAIARPM